MKNQHARTLLVVEDSIPISLALKGLFERRGWTVLNAPTIAEAMRAIDLAPDLACILLDLRLPDGLGHQVLARVRREDLPIRVAIVTAADDADPIADEIKAMRPDAYVRKPVVRDLLIAAVEGETDGPG